LQAYFFCQVCLEASDVLRRDGPSNGEQRIIYQGISVQYEERNAGVAAASQTFTNRLYWDGLLVIEVGFIHK
jgi:hypothetical protein